MARSPLDDPFPDLSGPAVDHGVGHEDDDPLADLRPLAPVTWGERFDDLRTRVLAAPARALGTVAALVVVAGVAWWFVRPPASVPIESQIPLAGESTPTAGAGSSTTTAGAAPAGASTTTSLTTARLRRASLRNALPTINSATTDLSEKPTGISGIV